jgi:hypothetical protein
MSLRFHLPGIAKRHPYLPGIAKRHTDLPGIAKRNQSQKMKWNEQKTNGWTRSNERGWRWKGGKAAQTKRENERNRNKDLVPDTTKKASNQESGARYKKKKNATVGCRNDSELAARHAWPF